MICVRFKGLGLAAALLIAACGRTPTVGPPKVLYGQDVCSNCDMIVSDERFAAAIVQRAGGDERPLIFDDIGCLLEYEKEHPQSDTVRYFHDAGSHQWITTSEPVFVQNAKTHTPMGSGIAAFSDRSSAEKALSDPAAHLRTFAELAAQTNSTGQTDNSLSTR